MSENIAGLSEKFGAFVQSKSKMHVDITAAGYNAGGKTSTISSYTTHVKDSNNNVVGTYSGASFTTDFISRSGTFTLVTTVKDSRGRVSDAVTRTITVLGYTKPTISNFVANRSDSDETVVDVSFSAFITPLDDMNVEPEEGEEPETTYGNDKSFKLSIDQVDIQEYVDTYSKTNQSYNIQNVSANISHKVTLTVTDYFTSVSETVFISTGFAIMHISEDGKHIGFGQRCDPDDDSDVQIHESLSIGGIKIIWVEEES